MIGCDYSRNVVSHQSSRISQQRPPSSRISRQQQQHRRRGHPVRCNRCRKALSGTVFVLSCNCIFCEECTYSHFEKNPNCPKCNRKMSGEQDIREITILKPAERSKQKEMVYKRMFVKSNPQELGMLDLWDRIQRQTAMHRMGTKFVLKQFLMEITAQTDRSLRLEHTLRALKEDHSSVKRELGKQRETTEAYKQQLIVAREKIEEKNRQVSQFRQMHASTRISSSNGSIYSDSGRNSYEGGQQSRVIPSPKFAQAVDPRGHQSRVMPSPQVGRNRYDIRLGQVNDPQFPPPSSSNSYSRKRRQQHGHSMGNQQPGSQIHNPYSQPQSRGSQIHNPYSQPQSRGSQIHNPYSQPQSRGKHIHNPYSQSPRNHRNSSPNDAPFRRSASSSSSKSGRMNPPAYHPRHGRYN